MRPFLEQVQPGKDAFLSKRRRAELEARLGELSEGLRGGRARVAAVLASLLAREFRGAPLLPGDEPASNESPLQVQRAAALPTDATLDARAFGGEVLRLTGDLRDITVAEFLITSSWPMARTCRRRGSARRSVTTWSAAARRCIGSSTSASGS